MTYPSNNRPQMKIQSADESLHWISFNMKALVKELKLLNDTLAIIAGQSAGRAQDQSRNENTPF